MSNFPIDPSTGATHAIGDKTWEWNGSAWQKIFSGDGIRAIGISGGAVSIGRSGLNFDSDTVGLTLSLHSSGNTASLIIKGDALASTSGRAEYTYTVVSGVLNTPNATSNGQFIYNDDTGQISIYKFDNDGGDFRTQLSQSADGGVEGVSSKINVVVGTENRTKVFEVDAEQVTYDGTNFDAASSNLQGNTAGTGKKVTVFIDQGSAFIRAKEYRFPDGTSASSIVTSFNGETGAVTTTSTVLPVAGITATSGITIGGDIQAPNDFHIRNASGETVIDVATRNVNIGDVDSGGNDTDINIRDSHSAIYVNAGSQIRLNAPDVYIEQGGHLGALSDTDTYLDFEGSDKLFLVAGGNTLMQATATNTNIGGVTFGVTGGGATFGGDVIITSDSGDIALTIKADTDNSTENDNPIIRLEEDGGASSTDIGLAGSDDHPFSGALANAFYIRPTNDTTSFQQIQLATGNSARVTLDADGNFGINEKFPDYKLDIDGVARFQTGVSLGGGGITFSDGTNMKTAAAGGGGVTSSVGFILDGNGSPITTGIKLDALKQIPIGSQVVRTSAYVQSGVTGYTSQIEFSFKKIPTLSSIASEVGTGGSTLDLGITASSDQTTFVFNGTTSGTIFYRELGNLSNSTGATIDAREWIFPHVLNNNGNVDKIQFFIEMAPT
jgi:hypothetical protein